MNVLAGVVQQTVEVLDPCVMFFLIFYYEKKVDST